MENNKDIGKAFREKLDGLQKQPGNAVWDAIKKDLPKKKSRFLPLFWIEASTAIKTVVVVLVALLMLSSGYFLSSIHDSKNSFSNPKNAAVNTNIDSTENSVNAKKNTYPHKNVEANNNNGAVDNDVNNNSITNTDNKNRSLPENTLNSKAGNTNALVTTKKNSKPNSADNILLDTDNTKTGTISKHTATTPFKNNAIKNGRKLKYKTGNTNSSVTLKSKKNSNSSTGKSQQLTNNTSRFSNGNKEDKSLITPVKEGNHNTTIQKNNNLGSVSQISNNLIENGNAETDSILQATDSISQISDSLCNAITKDIIAICEDTVEENTTQNNKADVANFKRFYVFGYTTPASYSLNDALLPDASLTGNATSTNAHLGYGAYIGYNLNRKWSVQTGIAITGLEHTTKNALLQNTYSVVPGTDSNPNGYVHVIAPANYTAINYTRNGSNAAVIQHLDTLQSGATVNIIQKIEFAEVPVEVTYSLPGNKFGAGVTAGLSTIFTTKNIVYAQNSQGTLWLGSNKNVKDVGFSTTIGLHFYYRPLPYLQINANPVFKYYLNTFNNGQPYSFGLQAGLQYNFNFFGSKK